MMEKFIEKLNDMYDPKELLNKYEKKMNNIKKYTSWLSLMIVFVLFTIKSIEWIEFIFEPFTVGYICELFGFTINVIIARIFCGKFFTGDKYSDQIRKKVVNREWDTELLIDKYRDVRNGLYNIVFSIGMAIVTLIMTFWTYSSFALTICVIVFNCVWFGGIQISNRYVRREIILIGLYAIRDLKKQS